MSGFTGQVYSFGPAAIAPTLGRHTPPAERRPANTRRWLNAVLMLARRLRRRSNIETALSQRLGFAGRRRRRWSGSPHEYSSQDLSYWTAKESGQKTSDWMFIPRKTNVAKLPVNPPYPRRIKRRRQITLQDPPFYWCTDHNIPVAFSRTSMCSRYKAEKHPPWT